MDSNVMMVLIIANSVVAISYASIPVCMAVFITKRKDLPFSWIFVLFAAFILACGTTHVMHVVNIFRQTEMDWWQAGADSLTAVISLSSAILIWPMLPRLLTLPSPTQLRTVNQELQLEKANLEQAQKELRSAYAEVEQRISERTHELELALADLQTSERQYREIFNATSEAIFIHAVPDGELLHVNESMLKMYGYASEEEALSQHIVDLSLGQPPYAQMNAQSQILKTLQEGPQVFEWLSRKKNGETFWTEVSLRGSEIGGIVHVLAVVRDISERKKAEKALRESIQNHTILFETMSEGIALNEIVYDETGAMVDYRIVDVNKAFYSTVDYQGRKVVGELATKLYGLSQEYVQNFLQEHKEKKSTVYSEMLSPLNKRYFYVATSPIINYKFVTSLFEITERKQAQEKLAQYSEHLEDMVKQRTHQLREVQERLIDQERIAVIGQLAEGLGQELRNPLGIIKNAIYFLKMHQAGADEKTIRYFDIIDKEVGTAKNTIEDLQDFARATMADREAASASMLIRQALERFPAPSNVQVTVEVPKDLPNVRVDIEQITQALSKFMVNSYEAMPEGGKLDIESCPSAMNGELMIIIKDNGVGIPPESMKNLFEPLFTTKAKGVGLGLAVSRKLIEANGGRIEVSSEAGVGSTFTIFLPIHGQE